MGTICEIKTRDQNSRATIPLVQGRNVFNFVKRSLRSRSCFLVIGFNVKFYVVKAVQKTLMFVLHSLLLLFLIYLRTASMKKLTNSCWFSWKPVLPGMYRETCFYFIISSHKIIGSHVCQCKSEIQPGPSIILQWPSISCPLADVRREPTPSPLPTALWEEFWWSYLTISSEFKQSVLTCLPHRAVAYCCSHLIIIIIINNLISSSPPPQKKRVCLSLWAVRR